MISGQFEMNFTLLNVLLWVEDGKQGNYFY